MVSVYSKRFSKFAETVAEKYDGALITPGSNLFYLTGLDPKNVMERLFIFLLYPDRESVLISPDLYKDTADRDWIDEKMFWGDDDQPIEILEKHLDKIKNEKGILLIEDDMELSKMIPVQDFIKDFKLEPLSSETSSMRITKGDQEIEYMQRAAEIVDETFYELIQKDLEGKTEKEVAALIEFLIKKNGGEGPAFETIVASGPNAANPHHSPSDKKLKKGELVIMDFGAKYNGYCSDITRTIAVKESSDRAKEVYEIVQEAQDKACKIVKNNIKVNIVDKTAREIIKKAGYGEYFTHRLGHGIGLDPHEEPYLTSTGKTELKEGMVFTIEPGIYITGNLGIRIEDDLMVRRGKGKRLTKAERDLKVV
ncbi:MAG: M24 family metallopeptidase [Thermoplasmatota archaeon]